MRLTKGASSSFSRLDGRRTSSPRHASRSIMDSRPCWAWARWGMDSLTASSISRHRWASCATGGRRLARSGSANCSCSWAKMWFSLASGAAGLESRRWRYGPWPCAWERMCTANGANSVGWDMRILQRESPPARARASACPASGREKANARGRAASQCVPCRGGESGEGGAMPDAQVAWGAMGECAPKVPPRRCPPQHGVLSGRRVRMDRGGSGLQHAGEPAERRFHPLVQRRQQLQQAAGRQTRIVAQRGQQAQQRLQAQLAVGQVADGFHHRVLNVAAHMRQLRRRHAGAGLRLAG